nr:DUF3043 domain-containing protein [Naumannella cuiyingiana]
MFRPYQPSDRSEEAESGKVRRAVRRERAAQVTEPAPEPESTDSTEDLGVGSDGAGGPVGRTREKNRPTRTRKEAEAERRAKARPNLSKKEARRLATSQRREARMAAMAERDNTPEKQLLRDFFDARWNLLEFLLPALLLMLAGTVLASAIPAISTISLVVTYAFLGLALLDFFLAWRRFRALLDLRLPKSSPKGLLFYAVNRAMQIRRLRMPPPQVKRGEKI